MMGGLVVCISDVSAAALTQGSLEESLFGLRVL